MWTELILVTSTLLGAYAKTITASVGTDVLLTCHCAPDKHYVVWQIGKHRVVDHIPKFNETKIDDQFKERTQLFLLEDPGNCSLLLKGVQTVDNQTYTCHFKSPRHNSTNVTLIVREASPNRPTPKPLFSEKLEVPCAIGGVFFVLGILLTVFLTFRYREKCRRTTVKTPGPQDGGQNLPLNPGSV